MLKVEFIHNHIKNIYQLAVHQSYLQAPPVLLLLLLLVLLLFFINNPANTGDSTPTVEEEGKGNDVVDIDIIGKDIPPAVVVIIVVPADSPE